MDTATDASVLMVEDEERIRDSMRLFLEAEGYEFKAVRSAEEGLAELTDRAYDIVVSDYKLPGMDGLEFMREVGERGFKAAKVLTTAYGDEDLFSRARQLGAACCIEKPLTVEKLARCLTRLKSGDLR